MMISTLMSGYSRSSGASFGHEDCIGRIFGRRDPNGAGGLLPKLADGRDLGLDLVEAWPNVVKQTFARFRRRDASRGAAKKPNPKPLFEFSDGMAQRRLGDAQLRGGLREAALSRDGDKGQKVVQTATLHLWAPLISLCRF